MPWDSGSIGVLADVVQAFTGVVALGFGAWSYINLKRSQDARARKLQETHASVLAADRVDEKVADYERILKAPGTRSLQALSELKLQDLASDESIRATLERIQTVFRTDPWEGQADTVEDVNLVRFFEYVTGHQIDLSTEDLSSVVQKVRGRGGARYAVELYRRRSRAQYKAAVVLALLLLMSVLARVSLVRRGDPDRVAQPPVDSSPSPVPGGPGKTSLGPAENSVPRERLPTPRGELDSTGIAIHERQQAAAVLAEVTGTRRLMRSMDATADSGQYTRAVGTLREALARMNDLREQSPDGPPGELVGVIDTLNQQIASIVHDCHQERIWAIKWKQPVPECP